MSKSWLCGNDVDIESTLLMTAGPRFVLIKVNRVKILLSDYDKADKRN